MAKHLYLPGNERSGGLSRRQLLQRSVIGAIGLGGGLSILSCGDDDDASSTDTTAAGGETTTEGGSEASTGLEKLTELSSFPGPQFSNAFGYVTQELGFFEDEGVDYTIKYPGSTIKTVQTLVAGATSVGWQDFFGILVANSQNFPLKAIYRTRQGSSFGFAVPPGSPITTWDAETVRGKKLGISEFGGGEVPVLRGALFRLGLEEGTDFELVPVGEGGPDTVEALESGTVQMMAGSTIDFSSIIKAGVPLTVITPDYLKDFPGHTYATTPELLEEKRDLMVKFLRARTKGFVFGSENLPAAAQIAMDYAPASSEGLTQQDIQEYLENVWLGSNQEYLAEDGENYRNFGMQHPDHWESYQTFLVEAGVEDEGASLTEPVDVNAIVTNDLIAEVNDFDFDEIIQMAKDYKP